MDSLASNIVQFDTTTTTSSTTGDIEWVDASTSTVTIQNVCGNCGQHYYGYHQCPAYSWYPYSYPVTQRGEVAELKAWIEGFMDGRKMTERNLKKIQDKLQEFLD